MCNAIVERVKRLGKSINKRRQIDVVLYDVIFIYFFFQKEAGREVMKIIQSKYIIMT